jgi:AhpD family alkylhydroperoxidase
MDTTMDTMSTADRTDRSSPADDPDRLRPLTIEQAPEASRQPMRDLQAAVGFVPALAAAMANSPPLLRGFLAVRQAYQQGTFTPVEVEVLSLTAAQENACSWCIAFHTLMALKQGLSPDSVQALRAGQPPLEPKLAALSNFARSLLRTRGAVTAQDRQRFAAAGYTQAQTLEVVLGMAFSLMANYAGHLTDPPLDAPFVPHAWQRA